MTPKQWKEKAHYIVVDMTWTFILKKSKHLFSGKSGSGSKGQKGTGSRIRNTALLCFSRSLSLRLHAAFTTHYYLLLFCTRHRKEGSIATVITTTVTTEVFKYLKS